MAPVEESLLQGFEFRCRPDCALCCFTTPAVSVAERPRLLALEPRLPLLPGPAGYEFIASRGNGGACALLQSLKCRAHAVRPFPCRSYPVTVFLSHRIQSALVLSCPGVSLTGLGRAAEVGAVASPVGLDEERASVRAELDLPGFDRRARRAFDEFERARSRLERAGRWSEPLRIGPGTPGAVLDGLGSVMSAVRPPSEQDGLELLPLTFDASYGRIAFAGAPDGWRVVRLDEAGDVPEALGTFADPTWAAVVPPEPRALLAGYLTYVAARDSLIGQAMYRALRSPSLTVGEAVEEDLAWAAVQVLARGLLLERLHGRTATAPTLDTVAAGIRATDAEVLDRPAVGHVL